LPFFTETGFVSTSSGDSLDSTTLAFPFFTGIGCFVSTSSEDSSDEVFSSFFVYFTGFFFGGASSSSLDDPIFLAAGLGAAFCF